MSGFWTESERLPGDELRPASWQMSQREDEWQHVGNADQDEKEDTDER